jgi:hypothetical protein
MRAPARDEREHLIGGRVAELGAQAVADLPRRDEWAGDLLVVGNANLLKRMGEGVVSHIVEQCGGPDDLLLAERYTGQRSALIEQPECHPRQMPSPERVFEPRMRGAGIDEKGQPQLPHIPQALHHGRFEERQRQGVEADVVPERIAQNFHAETYALPRLLLHQPHPRRHAVAERRVAAWRG